MNLSRYRISNSNVAKPLVYAAGLLFAVVGYGQTTPAVPDTTKSEASEDGPQGEVIVLSRFEVRGAPQDSYDVKSATLGLKTQQPLIDISSAIQVLPRALVEDLGFNWLTTDYARYVSSGLNSYGGNNQFYLRGQRVTPMFKNGIQYYSSVDDNLTTETVEVVKGINSSLFGSLPAVSGMVMESTKIPLKVRKNSLGLSGAVDGSILRAELDSTGPLSKKLLGAAASYRFLMAVQSGDQEQISNDDRFVISPSIQFDWKTTTLRFRYEYSDIQDFGLYTNNFLDEHNEVSIIGGRDETYKAPWSHSGFAKNEFETNLMTRFSANVEGRLQVAYYQEDRDDHDNRAFLVSTPTGTGLQANVIIPVTVNSVLNSTVLELKQTQKIFAINDDFVANFDIAGSRQQTNFGFSVNYLYNSQGLVQPTIGKMSVVNPVYSTDPGAQVIPGSATNITETKVACFYVQDQANFFSDRVILTLGANWGWNEVVTHKPIAPPMVYSEAKGSDLTYKIGALWKITPHVSAYASQSTAFLPQGPGVVGQNGAPLPAITSTANELGFKTDGLLGGKVIGSIAYFDSETLNQPVGINPGTANFYSINGGQTTTKGLEFDLTLKPTKNLDIIATLFQGDGVINSAAYLVAGQPVSDLANRSFKETWSVLAKYRFSNGPLKGLMFGANAFHMGCIYLRPAPALPASTRYSVFASYPITKKFVVSANLDNATDEVYSAGGNNRYAVTIGEGRSLKMSLRYSF